ncbi:glycoside hydrolase family 16 protein [Actinomadura sp. 6N118]|uniref:glycoside hydrolase family 16 protein n=1 Tax=Actinomadura sp. 6N118 TaxID=3375151 RepID=UPI0037A8018F
MQFTHRHRAAILATTAVAVATTVSATLLNDGTAGAIPSSSTSAVGVGDRAAGTPGPGAPGVGEQGIAPGEPDPAGGGAEAAGYPTAAKRYKWGRPIAWDEFGGRRLNLRDWSPENANSEHGKRRPSAITVRNGIMKITGRKDGTTGAIGWRRGARKWGRWEARIRINRACACYNANLLLWPTTGKPWDGGGEVDWMETYGDNGMRSRTSFFLHYGRGARPTTISRQVRTDLRKWHTFAIQWNSRSITGYIDGKVWFHSNKRQALPPRAMGQSIQLDFFPKLRPTTSRGVKRWYPATLEVDWIRMYRP